MARIIQTGNEILRQTAKEIPLMKIKTPKIKGILSKMTDALSSAKDGVALAAPQIGAPLRIFIVKKEICPFVFINPKIIKISKKKQIVNEGCLSVNGVYGAIKRAEKLTIEALDEKGKKFTRGASGFMAQIIQHEMDHLDGVLFTDKATDLKKISNPNQ